MREVPIRVEARVQSIIRKGLLKVQLPIGKEIAAHLSKSLPWENLRIQTGDTVELEMTPYDFEKGRIVKHKKHSPCEEPPKPAPNKGCSKS